MSRNFMLDSTGTPTLLGMLVCGKTPDYFLHWRSQVDAYVELPGDMPTNKKVFNDNILPLLEQSQAFVFRNIQTGISLEKGGTKTFEYPKELIRECINNSLAHRDYSIDYFVNINIVPGKHIEIKNPGRFKEQLLITDETTDVPIRRIVANNPKANNPKLATILGVYDKWEGKGRGMKNLVSAALDGHIDLPYFVFYSTDALSLYIPSGQLVDDRINNILDSFSKIIAEKLNGDELTHEQKSVFAYFYKSEQQNINERYTLLLTPDNNHLDAIGTLAKAGIIYKHERSDRINSIYVVDRIFFREHFYNELRAIFGDAFDDLKTDYKRILNYIYLFTNFSKKKNISASLIGNHLYFKIHSVFRLKEYELYKRKVRNQFNELEKMGCIKPIKMPNKKGSITTVGYDLTNTKIRTQVRSIKDSKTNDTTDTANSNSIQGDLISTN
jgi:ATP-dependent DNA helicase RecG